MQTRQQLTDGLVKGLHEREEVVAVWIDGSVGRGVADDHSDVDLGVAVRDDGIEELQHALAAVVATACDAVLLRSTPRLTNVVTAEWLRADIAVRPAAELAAPVPGPVAVCYDPDERVVVDDSPPGRADPERTRQLVEEFLRLLGLLPVAVAREEWIGAYTATAAMAGALTELMQIENRAVRFGGALKLSARLTADQRAVFTALPSLQPDRDSVVGVQLRLGDEFLTRARRLAERDRFAYPARLEAAARAHLARSGLDLDG